METKQPPAPLSITVVIPTEDFSSPEKMEETLPEQSLLMAALNGEDVRALRDEITYQDEERMENIYYVDVVDYIETPNQTEGMRNKSYTVPQPTEVNFSSAASDALKEINTFIIAAPGSLHKVGEGIDKKSVTFFNYLHTSTISTMTPRAELSLVLRTIDGNIEKIIPFNFSNFNRDSDIKNMLKEKYDRGFGVALENISVISDAQDPALSKFVTCDITVRLSNAKYLDSYINNTYQIDSQTKNIFIEDLFYTNKHEKYSPSSKASSKSNKTHSAEIMLTLGYAKPIEKTLPTNPSEKLALEKNLHNMTQNFFLKPVDYDIIAEQTGQVILTVKYASSFDADMDSRSRKTFPNNKLELEKIRKNKVLSTLKDQVVKYKRNKGNNIDFSEIDRFIAYARQVEAVAGLKAREARTREIIDRITRRGERSFVLPYTISGLEQYEPPQQITDGNAEVDNSTDKPNLIVDYIFAPPTTRSKFLTKNKEENLGTNELRAIEFVLFGEIIDYVFEEFFSTSTDPKSPEYANFKAAIFSAFSFGIYDSNFKTKVDKIYGMRDAPVSLDVLWDMLINSPITEANGGFPKSRYYKDLVSNVYSHIYRSCDKAIGVLMSETTFESTSHTLRKIGVPEINAHEIYLPKASLEVMAAKRDTKKGYLGKQDIWDTLIHTIRTDTSGSQASAPPDKDEYCMVLFFTSHIPFSPVNESKVPDYIFNSFGQKGIVKGFSYSPVAIDGLLESAIASRTADSTPGAVDGDDKSYKSLLKVDISTLGFPVITPGMTVKVSEALLGLESGSKMKNSISNSYYVTRVQTTMNKGDYTTTIEGYPQLSAQSDDTNREMIKSPILLANKKFLSDMIEAYESYKVFSRSRSKYIDKAALMVKTYIENYFYGKKNQGMKGFFPQLITGLELKTGSENEFKPWNIIGTHVGKHENRYYDAGKFGYEARSTGGATGRSYSRGDIIYSNKLNFYDNKDYSYNYKSCVDIADEALGEILKDNEVRLASLYNNLRITDDSYFPETPGGKLIDNRYRDVEKLSLAAWRILHAIEDTYIPIRGSSVYSDDYINIMPEDYLVACRTFMEIMASCSGIWRLKVEEIANNLSSAQAKNILTNALNDSASIKLESTYGITEASQQDIQFVLKTITDAVEKREHSEVMKNLREDLDTIIDAELPL